MNNIKHVNCSPIISSKMTYQWPCCLVPLQKQPCSNAVCRKPVVSLRGIKDQTSEFHTQLQCSGAFQCSEKPELMADGEPMRGELTY